MKRRNFMKWSALAGAGVAIAPFSNLACTSTSDPTQLVIKAFEFDETTVQALTAAMESGELTAQQIVQHYLDRIEEIDVNGPALNSILAINPDALELAKQLDEERKAGNVRGALHGIPVVLKDNIDTIDNMPTTAGTYVLKDSFATEDAFMVQQLRTTGAIILAKANLSEWANFKSHPSSSGWSALGGQTKNPYNTDFCPCGSSAGSAVAVAANLAPLAIGTETNGSIMCPSSINGIVGIKPTVNLVSRRGIIPISHTQDTAGPMARTVTDAAILLAAMAEYDHDDVQVSHMPGRINDGYVKALDPNGLEGAKIGIAMDETGVSDDVTRVFNEAIEVMKTLGAEFTEVTVLADSDELSTPSLNVLLYEFKDGLNKYLASHPQKNGVKTLEDVIAFNTANPEKALGDFGQLILEISQDKDGLESEEYLTGLELMLRKCRTEGIDRVLSEHQLQAIISPTNGKAWLIDHENGDQYTGGGSSAPAQAGYPSITVPAGYLDDLPLGITFFGGAFTEATLIKFAYAFEQATKHRHAPNIS
jgi:amidase